MKNKSQLLIDFDNPVYSWPPQEDFPINENGRKIKDILLKDLSSSEEYLIITGFTSLANIVEIFGKEPLEIKRKTRILLGFEPEVRKRKTWSKTPLSDEIKEYWIDRGIDVLKGGMVIQTIEHIKNGNIEFRIKERQHSKLYIGDHHAILGSANFSKQGITKTKEATIRVGKKQQNLEAPEESNEKPKSQYESIRQKALNFWDEGFLYDMQSLLEGLLQKVPWDQALARALGEILEGNWMSSYPEFKNKIESSKLWPFQVSGLAKSLILLDQQGSVLIADPTGSGKTRMVTICILSLIHKLWESGKRDQTNTLVLCPKAVIENWEKESLELSFLSTAPISMGILQREGRNRNKAIKSLRLTNILVLDEAHNFLSRKTNRSIAFREHDANYVILATATPINKKADDLLRIIELLGPDNLRDEELAKLKELYRNPIRDTKTEDLKRLNGFIQKFILRRTKRRLNELIKKEPYAYEDKFGNRAKFPKVKKRTYHTAETPQDVITARQITEKSKQLKGLIYLRRFKIPPYVDKQNPEKVKNYYERRINTANGFTAYHIKNTLRSSRAALMEHIIGTQKTKAFFGLKGHKADTGNIIEKLGSFYEKPIPKCDFPELMPEWLTDLEQYHTAIADEIGIYQEILEYVQVMSDSREQGKAAQILKLIDDHKMLLVFDSTVLTLFYMRKLLIEKGYSEKIYLVSGTSEAARLEV